MKTDARPAYIEKLETALAGIGEVPSPFVWLWTGSRRAEHGVWTPVIADCFALVEDWLDTRGLVRAARVVRHGGAAGIDTMVHIKAGRLKWQRDRMPADWSYWGRRSGIIRNGQMVEKFPRPTLCTAVFAESSGGTADCAAQARAAGIPTVSITVEDLYLPHH